MWWFLDYAILRLALLVISLISSWNYAIILVAFHEKFLTSQYDRANRVSELEAGEQLIWNSWPSTTNSVQIQLMSGPSCSWVILKTWSRTELSGGIWFVSRVDMKGASFRFVLLLLIPFWFVSIGKFCSSTENCMPTPWSKLVSIMLFFGVYETKLISKLARRTDRRPSDSWRKGDKALEQDLNYDQLGTHLICIRMEDEANN